MAYWMFQANPKYSQILAALRDRNQIYWLVTRYSDRIQPDDEVLIWIAGKQAGIYAVARVLEPPRFFDLPPDIEIWILPIRAKGRVYTPVMLTYKVLDNPLLKSELCHDPVLRGLEVLRFPRNTNFCITLEQWTSVSERLNLPER